VDGAPLTRTLANGTVNYDGDLRNVVSLTGSDGMVLVPSLTGTVVVRRNTATPAFSAPLSSNDSNVPRSPELNESVSTVGTTYNVRGTYSPDAATILAENNLFVGVENVFQNANDSSGAVSNVERIDYLFGQPISVQDAFRFMIMERGGNDSFYIAAITGVSGGAPSSYATPLLVSPANYGPNLTTTATYRRFGLNTVGSANLNYAISLTSAQAYRGVIVPTTDLAVAGTLIHGYSLFASDVVVTNLANLVNWNTAAVYPRNTGGPGGVDLFATGATLYVDENYYDSPEPGSALLMGTALLVVGMMLRRRSPAR
jgi:hypothetical protein